MNIKELLLSDESDLRFNPLIKYINDKYNFGIIRNTDDKNIFKWVNSNNDLVHICFNPHKTLISINFKYIKEGLKQNKNMIFIFSDERDKILYMWKYKDSEVMINYNYSDSGSDIEYISVFDKNCEVL